MSQRLYKAKADHNGEWVFGYYLEVDGVSYILPEGKSLNAIVQVMPETVCQCTGFPDRKGFPIYDKDRLFDPHRKVVVSVQWIQERGRFEVLGGMLLEPLCYCAEYSRMVGNIYDKEAPNA